MTIAATTASATILNDDAGFSIADLLVIEGIGTASVTITRSGNLTQASSVTLSTAGGTATSGADFTAISNQLISFGIGVATQTVAVAITNDSGAETSEAFFANLSVPTNATILDAQATVTVRDNEFSATAFDGSNGILVNGLQAGALSGYSVSTAGDVNGDGFGDLLVGAPFTDIARADIGTSYLVFGGATVGAGGTLNLADIGVGGVTFQGLDQQDQSGFSPASAFAVLAILTEMASMIWSSVRRAGTPQRARRPAKATSCSALIFRTK